MIVDFLLSLDWTQIVIFLLTTVGGALLVWYRKRLKEWKKFWGGVLHGLHAIPELQQDVKGIRYFVSPNGGGSLMDSAKRTETAVVTLAEQVELVVQTMWAENDADDEVARFHCNTAGENTYVNQLYARWLSVGKAELMGWNFLNFVHPDDVDRVRNHWAQCRTENRQYRMTYRLVPTTGKPFTVSTIATPIPSDTTAKRWIGSIRRVEDASQSPTPGR